ncbi:MAG: protein-disulfide reductase DsbD domain-containing protein, partial [Lysobacterales bacterium]
MRLKACVLLWCIAWAAGPARAIDEADLLPVEEAFALSVSAPTRDQLELKWEIAPGYYLYRHRIAVNSRAADVEIGALVLPNGKRKTDEFFGDVETYRGTLIARQALTRVPAQDSIEVEVRYQGCADLGVCYPPEKKILAIELPQDPAVIAGGDSAPAAMIGGSAPAPLSFDNESSQLEAGPLPEAQAFVVDALVEPGSTVDNMRAAVRFTMPPGYYLYRDKTQFAVTSGVADVVVGKPAFPVGRSYRDEHFGDVTVYFDQVEVIVPLRGALAGVSTLPIEVSFQGCQEGGICYPPMQRTLMLPVAAALSTAALGAAADGGVAQQSKQRSAADAAPDTRRYAATTALAEDSRIAQSLEGEGRGLALLTFFGLGLLLAFTPCVLPMIPILSGIIAGAGPGLSTRRALLLSSIYVLASAVVFMIAGVAAGLAGANLQAAFQTPWVLILFAAIFVGLALSMFGLFEVQLPSGLQTRLANVSNRQRSGSLGGVAIMGALSALIVGPCVAPPLAGAVLYISQT